MDGHIDMVGVIFKLAQEEVVEGVAKEEVEWCCLYNMSMNSE